MNQKTRNFAITSLPIQIIVHKAMKLVATLNQYYWHSPSIQANSSPKS